ncbi:MAG: FAD-dependent oxidoreductase [Planctomycetales bacterium]
MDPRCDHDGDVSAGDHAHGGSEDSGGRAGEGTTGTLSDSLTSLGFQLERFKTGMPRLNGRTIDFSVLQEQPA